MIVFCEDPPNRSVRYLIFCWFVFHFMVGYLSLIFSFLQITISWWMMSYNLNPKRWRLSSVGSILYKVEVPFWAMIIGSDHWAAIVPYNPVPKWLMFLAYLFHSFNCLLSHLISPYCHLHANYHIILFQCQHPTAFSHISRAFSKARHCANRIAQRYMQQS